MQLDEVGDHVSTQLLDYITGPVPKFCSYVETVQLRSFNAPTKQAVMKVTTLTLSSNLQRNKQGDVKRKRKPGHCDTKLQPFTSFNSAEGFLSTLVSHGFRQQFQNKTATNNKKFAGCNTKFPRKEYEKSAQSRSKKVVIQ